MASLFVTATVAAAAVAYSLRLHWQSWGLVHPVYKVKVCAKCRLPRDASVFSSAASATCRACQERRITSGSAEVPQRPPGRVRLLKAQVARIQRELKGKAKAKVCAAQARGYLGISVGGTLNDAADALWEHLECKLQPGMTEDNYGQWHVDHSTPVSLYDLTAEEHRRRCFHHANLAPMWASDNMAKGSTTSQTAASVKHSHAVQH